MTQTSPPLAIGLPVYNGSPYLAGAIQSLLAQTYGDFELIISDNGSNDDTQEVCQQFAQQDRRVRYIRQPQNLGAIKNFNHVFEVSNSPYFKWAAHDDVCEPTFLQACIDQLESDNSIGWCHSLSSHIGPDGSMLDDPRLQNVSYIERGAETPSQRFGAVLLQGEEGCLDSYAVMRSELVRRTPLILSCYGAEKVFIAEMALLGRYAEVPEVLFHARVHGKGSGALESGDEQQEYMCGSDKRARLPRLQLLSGYLSAVRRTPLPFREKLACYKVIACYIFQIKKWGGIIRSTLTGRGIGGGNVERLVKLKNANHSHN